MDYFIGIGVALAAGISATVIGVRDRSFYPTILIVSASYYNLFAAMSGSMAAVAVEAVGLAAFIGISIIGFRTNLWFVVAGLLAHGTLDLVHGHVIETAGVPVWWPMFCLTFDVTAAGYLAWLLTRSGDARLHARRADRPGMTETAVSVTAPRDFAREMQPFVNEELRAAAASEAAGETDQSFRHLERAHVLGQRTTLTHVQVHFRMLTWALRHRDVREAAGQMLRIVGATLKTARGKVPLGNTGGSNVSPYSPMQIPSDLAQIITRVMARSLA
jgi:hypothetical protein